MRIAYNECPKQLSWNVRKRTIGHVRPAKIHISLRLCANKDNNNVTYENTDAQTKKSCNRETALELSVRKLLEA